MQCLPAANTKLNQPMLINACNAIITTKIYKMQYPWGHERPYNSYAAYTKEHFGARVQKISINAGFTCPNRDGSKGTGGCAYCNNDSFSPSYLDPSMAVKQQIDKGVEFHQRRYRKAASYLAYFQAYSNTYASLETLKKIYQPALDDSRVAGLVIGTRADCIDPEKIAYFQQLSREKYVAIEYGIESCYDTSLEYINRCHSFADLAAAVQLTSDAGIKTGGHIILGLPGETHEQMLQAASILSELPLNSLKLHQLQIIKGTRFAKEYAAEPSKFNLFSSEAYAQFVCGFLERLRPSILIERLASESPPAVRIAPDWGNIRNYQFVEMVEKLMVERSTWQGKLYRSH
jgi:uncharacterized protein